MTNPIRALFKPVCSNVANEINFKLHRIHEISSQILNQHSHLCSEIAMIQGFSFYIENAFLVYLVLYDLYQPFT